MGFTPFPGSIAFDEVLVAPQSQRARNWFRIRDGALSFPRARSGKGTKGPRSLGAICLRVLADNIDAISEDWLYDIIEFLPGKLTWELWKQLAPRNVSLRAWSALSYELEQERFQDAGDQIAHTGEKHQDKITVPMALRRYCQEIFDPPCGLDVYTIPLLSLSGCLAYLCIDNVTHFEVQELLSLPKLSALEVLELVEREPSLNGMSDRVIRGWTESATCFDPFPSLRVMKITSSTHAVSEGSLRYVLRYPRLEIFDITALPASRWRNASSIADSCGWKATKPGDSLFVSYAEAYLDGRVDVRITGVEGLRQLFEDDRQRVALVPDPRKLIYLARTESRDGVDVREYPGRYYPDAKVHPRHEDLDFSGYLDESWQSLLGAAHPLCAAANSQERREARHQGTMTDNEVFWFLSLLSQKEFNPRIPAQAQAAGITLLTERFVSLRLRGPFRFTGQHQGLANSERLIFSRTQRPQVRQPEMEPRRREESVQTESRRPGERRETDLKPRKRQKLSDVLSSFGVT
ncbi:hypothetical protein MMYC01_201330 [Madurella mycetomatis]|uniref:Uncharacterized protein n=1 Tax=Madurella mycetomatis TaxID=100816 RepID=A0A175WFF5_9PEZI|nr:hypothetical protein MMYC01_201330 [Madurella mycetomatis]